MQQWVTSSSQFFSYYPKYEYLDNVMSLTSRKKLNIFIDVKGCAQALFQEWAVRHIIDHSRGSTTVDTSLFSAVLEFITFHKTYAKKRQLDLNLYFFMESGKSTYHLDVYKEYKANRGLSDMFGLDLESRELFYKILDRNYTALNKVVNRLPNCSFIRLEFLEADFVPYYIMNSVMSKEEVDSAANIVYSGDKDMLQCMDSANKFQYCKHGKNVKMLSYKDIYQHWLKMDLPMNDPANWFPLALSIIGDTGDGFAGVNGIGPVKLVKTFENIMTLTGNSIQVVYENISKNKPIFNKEYQVKDPSLKLIIDNHDIIVRNLKLSSFKLLSDAVNGDFPLYMIERKKQINECCSKTQPKCSGAGVLINALNQNGLMGILTEQTIGGLF